MLPINRRQFLAAGAPFALMAMSGLARAEQVRPRLGLPQAFSFDGLRQRAKELADRPYVPPVPPAPATVAKIDFDAVQKIKFRPDRALWPNGPADSRCASSTSTNSTRSPCASMRSQNGTAREVLYSAQDFAYNDPAVERIASGRSRLLRIPGDGRPRAGHRLAGLPGRQLFSQLRRREPVRRLRARHRRQHGHADSGRVSPFRRILAGRA